MGSLFSAPFGRLTSKNCIVDEKWLCKITDLGFCGLRQKTRYSSGQLLWTAPELLGMENQPFCGTFQGDIYSYGILLYELWHEEPPYCKEQTGLSYSDIIERIKSADGAPFRPVISGISAFII